MLIKKLDTDGKETILPEDDSLEAMQAVVGGYVEVVRLGKVTMLVNEEGLIKKMNENRKASQLSGQYIVGPVVLIEGNNQW